MEELLLIIAGIFFAGFYLGEEYVTDSIKTEVGYVKYCGVPNE